jgi:hypothetical protein
MKRSFIIYILLILVFQETAYSQKRNDRKMWGLTDNVISVHETWFKVKYDGDEVKKGNKISDKFEIESMITFDQNGNKIEDQRYDMDGNATFYLKYTYNDKLNSISEYRYSLDGTILHKTIWNNKYNTSGELIEKDKIKEDSSILEKVTFKYDVNGNLSENQVFDQKGKLIRKNIFVNDDKGNVLSQTIYNGKEKTDYKIVTTRNADGKVIEETYYKNGTKFDMKYTYKYNDKGNQSELNWYIKENKPPRMTWTHKYEYDRNGNWTKAIQFNGKKAISITERVIKYS